MLVLLLACHQPTPPPPPVGSTQNGTADTAPVNTAGTADTASTSPPEGFFADVAPSLVVSDLTVSSTYQLQILPPVGSDPALLVLRGSPDDVPPTRVVPLPADGDHDLDDLWDGVSGFDAPVTVHHAGDIDGDGHLDGWVADRHLLSGPFLGALHPTDGTGAVASLADDADGDILSGHHDLDGDGLVDLVTNDVVVHYGPFGGTVDTTSSGFDPARMTTWYGPFCGPVTVVDDLFGPGRHAVSYGGLLKDCSAGFLELVGPRGVEHGRYEGTVLRSWRGGGLDVPHPQVGDLDGDGVLDLLITQTSFLGFTRGYLARGPFGQSEFEFYESDAAPALDSGPAPLRALGDLDGDGISELLAVEDLGDGFATRMWVLFSPYDGSVPQPRGLVLGRAFAADYVVLQDMDGDGTYDLATVGYAEDATEAEPDPELWMWSGADLAQRWVEVQLD